MKLDANFFVSKLISIDLTRCMDIAIKLNNEYISDQLTFQLSEGIDGDGKEITNQVTGSSSYANFGYKGRW